MSHFLLTVPATDADAEILAADLWALGAVGVEELTGELRGAFTDHAAAVRARDRLAPAAAIDEYPDSFGLDASRDLLTVQLAGRFAVHPPWLDAPDGFVSVEIDPGHAFGSGSHASTRLALELLGSEQPSTVFDIGCGTGVLSIAAARSGAMVDAVDNDPAAVQASVANATRNGVADRITVTLGSADHVRRPRDLVVVNVTIDIHETLAPLLDSSHHRLLVAGILDDQLDRAASAYGADVESRIEHEGWMAAVLTRP